MGSARPYGANKIVTFCILTEVVLLYSFFVYIIAFLNFNTGINDWNQMNAQVSEDCWLFA
jgi:hypothetical protein